MISENKPASSGAISMTDTEKIYLNAYLMMKISAENSVSFLGKRRLKKEWAGYLESFHATDYEALSDAEKKTQDSAWQSFFEKYCRMCLTDPTYASLLFGMLKAKESSIEEKLAYELDRVLCVFPETLSMEAAFSPLHKAAENAYRVAVPKDGASH